MNFTKITISKIEWLLKTTEFRKNPFKLIYKIVNWEIFRKFRKRRLFIFDNDLKIYLYPNDGVARLTYYFGYRGSGCF